MKFGQFIEYNVEIFFLKNHTQRLVEKLVTDPFSEKLKTSTSLDQ